MTTTPKWLIDVIHITARSTSFRYQLSRFYKYPQVLQNPCQKPPISFITFANSISKSLIDCIISAVGL